MTQDKSNPYIFECHNCGKEESFEGTPLSLSEYIAFIGWLNEAQPADEHGKVEYMVTCPKCAEAQADYAEWAAMDDENIGRGQGWL